MLETYPDPVLAAATDDSDAFAWVRDFVLGIRRIRAEYDIEPGKRLPVLVRDGDARERSWLRAHAPIVEQLARTTPIAEADAALGEAATALAGSTTVLVPLAELIDREAEQARLAREIERLASEIERARRKLDNQSFVERAPRDVVEKERRRLADAEADAARLQAELARLA